LLASKHINGVGIRITLVFAVILLLLLPLVRLVPEHRGSW
jgi:hypothetical protein